MPSQGPGYQLGFAQEFASEAVAGALPPWQNNPQRTPLGLFSELISGTTFSAPRASNRRSYVFRIRPSVYDGEFELLDSKDFRTPPLDIPPYPGGLRWDPPSLPAQPVDFLDGLVTICGNGPPVQQAGMAMHVYCANISMDRRVFSNRDGEFLIVPQEGGIRLVTEFGILDVDCGEVALIPRAVKFRVELRGSFARGYVGENFGLPYALPELGLIGAFGLANAGDFQTAVASFEDREEEFQLIHKYAGNLWSATLDHSPLDVVAWRGNLAPCKYDMHKFMAIGTSTVDHPDPSIYLALTSPSSAIAGGNSDFMILPPRWNVAENTFRPPGFHKNSVAEFVGVVSGKPESKATAYAPGTSILHNNWVPHGPDAATVAMARETKLQPQKSDGVLLFMFETRFPLQLTERAMTCDLRRRDYPKSWSGHKRRFERR